MGIRSEESIALGRIADKLQSLDNTMQKIEKDLHSIDISLGKIVAQNEKKEAKNGLNELEYPEFKVEETNFYVGDGVYEARTEKKMSWDEYFNGKPGENKEDNNETRN